MNHMENIARIAEARERLFGELRKVLVGQEEVIRKVMEYAQNLLSKTSGGLVAGIGVALLIGAAVWVLRAIRRLAHDAFRIGGTMFRRANAIVFAAVLLALPLFAAPG